MKISILFLLGLISVSCMKSKEEYRSAIEEVQREEEAPKNERYKGSNDAEGMGMDE